MCLIVRRFVVRPCVIRTCCVQHGHCWSIRILSDTGIQATHHRTESHCRWGGNFAFTIFYIIVSNAPTYTTQFLKKVPIEIQCTYFYKYFLYIFLFTIFILLVFFTQKYFLSLFLCSQFSEIKFALYIISIHTLHKWGGPVFTCIFLCPFAVYFVRYTVMLFFTISRIFLMSGTIKWRQRYIM